MARSGSVPGRRQAGAANGSGALGERFPHVAGEARRSARCGGSWVGMRSRVGDAELRALQSLEV